MPSYICGSIAGIEGNLATGQRNRNRIARAG